MASMDGAFLLQIKPLRVPVWYAGKLESLQWEKNELVSKVASHIFLVDTLSKKINVKNIKELNDPGGNTYNRWGRTSCPNDSSTDIVYKGFAGGGPHKQPGSGTNYLCPPKDPQWGDRSVIEQLATTVDRLRRIKTHGGTTYIRWGRTTCPDVHGSDLVYNGFVGGSPHQYSGGGANYICLPTDPQWGPDTSPKYKGYVYGAEYQSHGTFWDDKKNHDVPCAVCRTPKTNVLMIPARQDCYDGWNREYHGYLMAERDSHASNKEFICVDDDPEVNVGTHADLDGALLHFQETVCGSLPCKPYIAGRELTCVVCTFGP
ncbi:uncharacterized protein LOC128235639 [Mya arenaria]|uniref:uncharacterized protein LOC128235639 n=1 Tax=Mya arenaria TaxID=6604 RepID=UPI0022E8E59C|nr:uncharacterized protein LOC128235639 [Mya arenaria]